MKMITKNLNVFSAKTFLTLALLICVICAQYNCSAVEDKLALLNPIVGEDLQPMVVAASPAPGQKGVARTEKIQIAFNTDINSQKCTAAFSIQPSVTGLFEVAGSMMVFTPSEPLNFGTYVYSLSKNCEGLNGRDIDPAYTASFYVGGDATGVGIGTYPAVSSIRAATGSAALCGAGGGIITELLGTNISSVCTGNPSVSPIIITFSEPMVSATVESAFTITPSADGAFTWDGSFSTLTFTPDALLTFGQRYDLSISTLAEDTQGSTMEYPALTSFVAGTLDFTAPTITSVDLEQSINGSADACVAPANDSSLVASGSATEVCVTVPLVINFSENMSQTDTANAISFSPSISASYAWTAANQLTITPLGTGLDSNLTYTMTISTAASDLAGNSLQSDFGISFDTEDVTPRIHALGLASHGAGCNSYPVTNGGQVNNWSAGNCWWREGQTILGPSNYTFRGGNSACASDSTTDNIRIIFSRPMDPGATIGALSVRRLSAPINQVVVSSHSWDATNQILTLALSEAEAEGCPAGDNGGDGIGGSAGSSFGAGDFDLRFNAGVDDAITGYPLYSIEFDTTARDAGGVRLSSSFTFVFEGD